MFPVTKISARRKICVQNRIDSIWESELVSNRHRAKVYISDNLWCSIALAIYIVSIENRIIDLFLHKYDYLQCSLRIQSTSCRLKTLKQFVRFRPCAMSESDFIPTSFKMSYILYGYFSIMMNDWFIQVLFILSLKCVQ